MAEWISWSHDLTVHVDKIDLQHRELIRRFNDLGEAVWDGKGKEAIGMTLRFLADYTVEHFRAEEDLMEVYSYPMYLQHKKVHDDFVAEVAAFIKDFESKEVDSALIIQVLGKLGDWTRQHIRVMDKEVGEFIRSKM
ncbi:MAG: hemerythrin family protein [Deltaproteobacteria bacterium]|nr:hemerythrin family protein [Deltaproteobacteria bacterium]